MNKQPKEAKMKNEGNKQPSHLLRKMAGKHSKDGHVDHMGASHWQKPVEETEVADGRYCSEMNAKEELKGQVDGLANYTKSHKMKYS